MNEAIKLERSRSKASSEMQNAFERDHSRPSSEQPQPQQQHQRKDAFGQQDQSKASAELQQQQHSKDASKEDQFRPAREREREREQEQAKDAVDLSKASPKKLSKDGLEQQQDRPKSSSEQRPRNVSSEQTVPPASEQNGNAKVSIHLICLLRPQVVLRI